MKSNPIFRRYLRFWGDDAAADLDDELRFHIEARSDELVAGGMARADAQAAAEREFGDVARVRRTVRSMDEAHLRRRGLADRADSIARDVRYALRSLGKARSLSAVVIVTLALGIGLNSVIFSVINAYLFRPLPTPYAARLVVMGITEPTFPAPHEMSFPDYEDYRALHGVFDDVAAYVNNTASLTTDGHPERAWIDAVTGNLFTTLGVSAAHGRTLLPSDGANGPASVIVLSDAYWKRRFNADPKIVGDTIRIDGEPLTVVGIAPEGFRGVSAMIQVDGWMPIDLSPAGRRVLDRRDQGNYNIIGRLARGVSVGQAGAAVHARALRLQAEYPKTNSGVDVMVVPELRARPVLTISGPVPLMALVMGALAGLVLLVACANVASLLLARATARQREYAVRAALGASRWRLVRQSLVESLVLSFGGALCALAIARWATARLGDIRVATDAPVFFDFSLDWRVFLFTLAAAIVTAVFAGLFPALRGASANPQGVLAGGGRSNTDRRQHRLRGALVVAQIAVSTIVLIAAGLFARSTRHAESMDLGFRTDSVLTVATDLSLVSGYDAARGRTFYQDLVARVRALPGVRSAALAARIPFGYNNGSLRVVAPQRTPTIPDEGVNIFYNIVGLDYFKTMGPSLVTGRDFTTADDSTAPPVAVVNEAMAKRIRPTDDAVGKRFKSPETGLEYQVIGVTRTAQYMFVGEEPRPFFYLPFGQRYRTTMTMQVHAAGDPLALVAPIREIVRSMDANVPLFDVRTVREHLRNGRALFAVRFGAIFGATFGLLALVLASVGVYGVVSYSVTHRTREIGIRMALGARVSAVMRLVVRQGASLCLIGVAIGVGTALVATRFMASLLYDVNPADPLTFGAVTAVLAAVALTASILPARRATRVDPSVALRSE